VIDKKEIIRVATEMTGSLAHFTFESIIGASEELHSTLHMAKIAAKSDTEELLVEISIIAAVKK